jgi:hypothetical protein
MSFGNRRIHYFHADATAIGGHIERPFAKIIPVQSPVALSPSGGAYEASTSNFEFEKIMSASATRARVEGSFLGGLATTRMTAVVEGLNVLDVVRVEELVAYISTEHPGEGPDVPRVDFGRTSITGLRLGDSIVKVHLDLSILNDGNGQRFPKKPHLQDKALWRWADQKFRPEKGILICSLVKDIEVIRGKLPGKRIARNAIEIPNFGQVHLAELLVSGDSYELIMMRLELGCTNQGSSSMSAGKVNGQGGGG